jgi:hypothetical protein
MIKIKRRKTKKNTIDYKLGLKGKIKNNETFIKDSRKKNHKNASYIYKKMTHRLHQQITCHLHNPESRTKIKIKKTIHYKLRLKSKTKNNETFIKDSREKNKKS